MRYYVKPVLEGDRMEYCIYRRREESKNDEFILYCICEKYANAIAELLSKDEEQEQLWEKN